MLPGSTLRVSIRCELDESPDRYMSKVGKSESDYSGPSPREIHMRRLSITLPMTLPLWGVTPHHLLRENKAFTEALASALCVSEP
jgi:hypothetical protein